MRFILLLYLLTAPFLPETYQGISFKGWRRGSVVEHLPDLHSPWVQPWYCPKKGRKKERSYLLLRVSVPITVLNTL